MEPKRKEAKSIFDDLEANSGKPEIFEWKKDTSLFKYNEEDVMFENTLTTQKLPNGGVSRHIYLLTVHYLYKYKVSSM
jgi:hypothetical protein